MVEWDYLNGILGFLKFRCDFRIVCVFWDFYLCVVVTCDFKKYFFIELEMEVFMVLK